MIDTQFASSAEWMGQKVRFKTTLFDKEYFWLEDIDGMTYLAKVGADGNPSLL